MLRLVGGRNGHIFAMVTWQVWKERNNKYWQGTNRVFGVACRAVEATLIEWDSAQLQRVKPIRHPVCLAWHPLPADSFKINVDVAFFDQTFETGVGKVLHDTNGVFIRGCTLMITDG